MLILFFRLLYFSVELIGVAEKLLERETINQDDVIAIIGERPFDSADNYHEILNQSWKRTEDEGVKKDEEEDVAIDGAVLASRSFKR